jgi:hypothetical protein
MEILVFSGNPKVAAGIRLTRRNKLVTDVRVLPWSDFRPAVCGLRGPAICYLDLSSLEAGRLRECERFLSKHENVAYGLVDPGRTVTDVAEVFHRGAVDYVDRAALQRGITADRLKRIRGYVEGINHQMLKPGAVPADYAEADGYIESPGDWSAIRRGREYTFQLMFIELDGKELMEKKYGVDNLTAALGSFRSYLEGFVRPFQGRLWAWYRFGGIVLFPFGRAASHALPCVFRLVLFKHFYDIEGSYFPNFLSFRVAMHIGNLVYDGGNTGETVSDSLNSVFHLGQQYAKPGEVCVTQEVLENGPAILHSFFVDGGTFEGRRIFRMRRPVHG